MRSLLSRPPCSVPLRCRRPASAWDQPAPRRAPMHLPARAASTRAAAGEHEDAEEAGDQPHVPVLLEQVLSFFRGRKLGVYVDATLGAGGHASAVLREHPELGIFIGIDQDPTAHTLAAERVRSSAAASTSVHLVRSNFRGYASAVRSVGPHLDEGRVDGALFDLGMSSMQVDTADRGFSFLREGPLDMRMDPTAGISAEDVINTWTEAQLAEMFRDYGEERKWRFLARRVIEERELRPIRTTTHFADVCARAIGFPRPQRGGARKPLHPATRAFQALRIAVNQELAVVEEALPAALASLAPGGRLAVISFHSLEDRIVKNIFRAAAGKEPMTVEELNNMRTWGKLPPVAAEPEGRILTGKPVVAEDSEADLNPRSRSAKLRVFEKAGGEPEADGGGGGGGGREGRRSEERGERQGTGGEGSRELSRKEGRREQQRAAAAGGGSGSSRRGASGSFSSS